CSHRRRSYGKYHIHIVVHQLTRTSCDLHRIAVAPSILERHVLTVDPALALQPSQELWKPYSHIVSVCHQNADAQWLWLSEVFATRGQYGEQHRRNEKHSRKSALHLALLCSSKMPSVARISICNVSSRFPASRQEGESTAPVFPQLGSLLRTDLQI